jgi:hypothetical protein
MPAGLRGRRRAGPAPARLIEGGLPTEATVAQVLVSKYADHLPLYRQAQIYARQGIDLDRSTLADWVGHAAWHLRPLHERLLLTSSSNCPGCSRTRPPLPVLDPGRGRTKTGQLWAYAADDRPWGGSDPPGVAYVYAPDRKAERPIAHLEGFKGVCRSMAMPATASWPSAATSSSRSAGRMCGVASMNWRPPVRADCQRSARTHCRTLCRREGHPWPQRRRTPGEAAQKPTAPWSPGTWSAEKPRRSTTP